jgi:RND family efflux transporter MFP subunit
MIVILRRFLVPSLAMAGLAVAVLTVMHGQQPPKPAQPLAEPAAAPFASYIGGTGQIEPPGQTIAIAAPDGGIIAEVAVRVGDTVYAGQTLFRLDNRVQEATRDQRAADLAAARAQVAEAQASLADYRNQLRLAESISDRRAVSAEDLAKRHYAVKLYEAKLATAQAQVTSATAQLVQAETSLQRLTIGAPVDALVLQVNVRQGEYAPASQLNTPLVMLGRTGKLHVRVEIDENDAWRFRAGAAAKAYLRGNRDLSSSLTFHHVEPYVTPKKSLTGDSTERVDTRVLQAVFEIDAPAFPIFTGQIVDVFIEVPPLTPMTSPAAPAAIAANGKGGS